MSTENLDAKKSKPAAESHEGLMANIADVPSEVMKVLDVTGDIGTLIANILPF